MIELTPQDIIDATIITETWGGYRSTTELTGKERDKAISQKAQSKVFEELDKPEMVEKVAETIWEDEYKRSNPLVTVTWDMLPEWSINTYMNLAKLILSLIKGVEK